MSDARRVYAELLKIASSSESAAYAKHRALGKKVLHARIAREMGKEAALDPELLRRLALLGGGLSLAGGGLLAGRYLFPRSPSEAEALKSIGITEPGEYSVGVSPDVFGASDENEKNDEDTGFGTSPYGGAY